MKKRRAPVQSVLAERKMFSGGGMLPISKPMEQKQPSGILASSSPLIEVAVQEALAPINNSVLMNKGGIAKFQQGGGAFAPLKGPRATIGIGESPADMLRRRDMKPSELVNEMFPYSAGTGVLNPMMRSGFVGSDPRGEASPIERGGQFIMDFIDQAGRGLLKINASLGRAMYDIGEGLLTRAPKDVGTETIIAQVSAVNDSLRRMPKVEGVSDEEMGLTIKGIAEAATTENPNISGDELSARIAKGVLSKYEGPPSEGYAMARDDAQMINVDNEQTSREILSPTEQFAKEDANRSLVDAFEEDQLPAKINEYRIAMADGPDAQMKFAQQLSANPNFSQDFKDAVFQSADVGPPVDSGAEFTVEDPRKTIDDSLAITNEKGELVIDVDEKPPVSGRLMSVRGSPDEKPTVSSTKAKTQRKPDDSDFLVGGPRGLTVKEFYDLDEERKYQGLVPGDPEEKEKTAAAQVAKVFDKKNMPEKEAVRTIKDYKKEFLDEIPEYEGLSEEEKGFALMEAGLRVAAGESPNAITNVAKGLKGLGAEFAKDKKAKRAWDRQVELSAVKYGIERFNKNEENKRVLETTTETLIGTGKGSFTLPNGKVVNFDENEVVFVPKSVILKDGVPSNLLDPKTVGFRITAAATRAKTAQANQKAIRDELIVKDKDSRAFKKEFLAASDKVVLGYEVKALIESSFDISDQAVGLNNFGKELIFKGLNATGWRPDFLTGPGTAAEKEARVVKALGGRTEYNQKMQEVANRLLKRLLGEGSKNVSNVDRLLAQEISGLVKEASVGITSNPTLLRGRLKRILDMADKDIRTGETEMQTLYGQMSTRVLPGTPLSAIGKGGSYAERVLDPLAREALRSAQGRRQAVARDVGSNVFGTIPGFTFKGGKYVVESK